jgi:kynurenine formamidase
MSALSALVDGMSSGQIQIIDLTARLSSETPILQLPENFGQTQRFELEEISRYDDRGPSWYWNNFRSGEHTGTHFDAPNHWATGERHGDVADVPVERLIRPAVVLDFSAQCAKDSDFLLEVNDIKAWEQDNGTPPVAGCCIAPAGTAVAARSRSSSTLARPARTHPG